MICSTHPKKERKGSPMIKKGFLKSLTSAVLGMALVVSVIPAQPVKAENKIDMGAAGFDTTIDGEFDGMDIHIYKFSLDKSGTVDFNYSFDKDWCTFVVYDESGDRYIDRHASTIKGGTTYNDSLTLLGGDYEIELFNRDFAADDTHKSYSFSLSFTDAKETVSESYSERNNETSTATSYKLGKNIKALLTDNDKLDIYKFEMKKDGFVTLKLDSDIKSVNVEVNSSFGDIKNSTSNIEPGKHEYKYFCAAGTYYFTCKENPTNIGIDTGIYSFTLKQSKFPTVAVKKVTSTYSGQLTATIGRNEDVTGYEVQVATDSKFKKNTKSATTSYSNDTVSISGLNKNTAYYVRVRTYVYAGNKKYYSPWKVWGKKGKLKTIKVKG